MKELELKFLDGGYCTHPERMVITDGRFRRVRFPSMFNLIRHPERGNILFDTGYSMRFFEETRSYPERLYARVTPVHLEERDLAVSKLRHFGIAPEDVDYVILSHFHADHMAAAADFPRARYIYLQSAYDFVRRQNRVNAVRQGILRGLLPADFVARSEAIEDRALRVENNIALNDAFTRVYDIFGDSSLYAVDLPGHIRGHMGLFLRDREREHFLIADACWLSRSYRRLVYPSRAAMLIMDDSRAYKDTLQRIHRVYRDNPAMNIAPSHCGEVYCSHVECKSDWGRQAMNAVDAAGMALS